MAARIWGLRTEGERDADFARRIGFKSQQALNELTKGKGGVSSTVLAEVVRRTGVDPAYLLLGDEGVEIKSVDRARLEEVAAILQRAGVISTSEAPDKVERAKQSVDRSRSRRAKDAPQEKVRKRRAPGK